MDFLTDLDKDKIATFVADEAMMEAVKKVLLAVIYGQGTIKTGEPAKPVTNAALMLVFKTVRGEAIVKNEQLGEDLRALAMGLNYLEAGFQQLTKINGKEAGGEEPKSNPAI